MPDNLITAIVYTVVIISSLYFAFPRQFRNAIYVLLPNFRKEFVIVHFRKLATKSPMKYYVIPDKKTMFGNIAGGQYDLHKENALPDIPLFRKRLNFLVDEGDSIPKQVELFDLSEKQVMFKYRGKIFFNSGVATVEKKHDVQAVKLWAFRVNSAFKTIAYDFLFGEKRQWAFIIACAAAAISIVVAIYAISEIQRLKPLVETIYERTIVGNQTIVIQPK